MMVKEGTGKRIQENWTQGGPTMGTEYEVEREKGKGRIKEGGDMDCGVEVTLQCGWD